jgi:hypothetical protein
MFYPRVKLVGGEQLVPFGHLLKPLALVLVKFWRTSTTRIWSETVHSVVISASDLAARVGVTTLTVSRCFRKRITEIDILIRHDRQTK